MGTLKEWATAIAEAGGTHEDMSLLLAAASDAGNAAELSTNSAATSAFVQAASHISSLKDDLSGARLPSDRRAYLLASLSVHLGIASHTAYL